MRMVLLLAATAFAVAVVLAPPAVAQEPTQDSATGSYANVSLFTLSFEFSARSGPSGEQPAGDFRLVFGETGFPPDFDISGTVTCLHVEGNEAVLGIGSGIRGGAGGTIVAVHDATGSSDDPFDVLGFYGTSQPPGSGDCPAPSSLPALVPCCSDFWGANFFASLGSDPTAITVHDAHPLATTKDQCKNGGWSQFGFENQGDCVSFVATGGKNPPRKTSG